MDCFGPQVEIACAISLKFLSSSITSQPGNFVITLIISVRTMLLVVNYMYFCFASVIWGGLGPPDHLPCWFLKP